MNYLRFRLIKTSKKNDATAFIEEAYKDAYKRFLGPAIERELRRQLTEGADEQAIKVFGENLYHLLMQKHQLREKLYWASILLTELVVS